jgi:hypothetical protein
MPASEESFIVFLSFFVEKTPPALCSDDCQPALLEAIAFDALGYALGTFVEEQSPYEHGLYLKLLERILRLRVEAFEEGRAEPLIDRRLIREVCTGSEQAAHDYRPYLDDWFGPESSDDGQSSVGSSDDGQSSVGSSDDGQSSVESSEDEGSTMLTGSVETGSGSTTSGLRRMMSRRTGRLGEQSQGSQSSDGDTSD